MITRKKVVPPVTPRIVQPDPRRRVTRYLLLLLALLLTAWFSYDYGRNRTQAPANTGASADQTGEWKQRVAELEQERETLKQQVEELEQSVKQANRAFQKAQTRLHSLQTSKAPSREEPASMPEPEPVATVPESAGNTLTLENIRIEPTETENVFTIGFSVMHDSDSSDRVTGTIWIAVNGLSGNEPRRLSFKTLSPDRRSYVKMGFDQQQDVVEEVVLPEGFRPKNVQIEAKPYGDRYSGTLRKITWSVGS